MPAQSKRVRGKRFPFDPAFSSDALTLMKAEGLNKQEMVDKLVVKYQMEHPNASVREMSLLKLSPAMVKQHVTYLLSKEGVEVVSLAASRFTLKEATYIEDLVREAVKQGVRSYRDLTARDKREMAEKFNSWEGSRTRTRKSFVRKLEATMQRMEKKLNRVARKRSYSDASAEDAEFMEESAVPKVTAKRVRPVRSVALNRPMYSFNESSDSEDSVASVQPVVVAVPEAIPLRVPIQIPVQTTPYFPQVEPLPLSLNSFYTSESSNSDGFFFSQEDLSSCSSDYSDYSDWSSADSFP